MLQTLRYAIRSLRNSPVFTLVSIVTLTLVIGATTAVFSVVNSVLLRPLPFREPDQLVWVWSRRPDNDKAPFSLPDFLDHRDQNQTLERLAAFGNIGLSLSGTERTDRIQGMRVSANLFSLLGLNASTGRLLITEDDEPGRRHVVVLTYECWQRRFASDSKIVGSSLILNGETYQTVGVLPRNVSLPNPQAELAIPLAPDVDPLRTQRGSVNFLRIIGRLKSGVSLRQAEADLSGIVAQQRQQYGEAYRKKTGVNLVPLHEEIVGTTRRSLWILFGAISLVLVIACCNLAALSFTRATARRQEIAIKKALGASSSHLVRQHFVESLILALIGGAAGLSLAIAGSRVLLFFGAADVPRFQETSIDFRIVGFVAGTSILCALICGILPAWQGTIVESNIALNSGTRGVGDTSRFNRWRSVLVVSEVALSFVLLIGAGLLIQSFVRVQSVDVGFDPNNCLALRLSLPSSRYKGRTALASFDEKFQAGLESLPGVEAVGAVSILPMSRGGNTIEFSVVGQATSTKDTHSTNYRVASPDYFRAMKISLMHGRSFNRNDRQDGIPVALINQTMARKLWPKGDAIGARVQVDDNNTGPRPLEIVGVVGDVRQLNLESAPTFDIYIPMAQIHEDNVNTMTNSRYWVVRSKVDSPSLEPSIIRELQKIDRESATSDIKPLVAYISDSIAPRRFSVRLLTMFSVAALLLVLTGIYGVISHMVTQRTSEIGIRLALGARPAQVFGLILAQGAKVFFIGLVLGGVGAYAMTRVIQGLLFNVAPGDPFTFVFVSVILLLVALIALSIPARRATKVDPLVALRNE